MIPSNSLAAMYGIAADSAEREVLGPDVAIDITVLDETNARIDIAALLDGLRGGGGAGRGARRQAANARAARTALTGRQNIDFPIH